MNRGALTRRRATATADSEPEPDVAVVRGDIVDYLSRHPGPGDVALVAEISDSSRSQDRELKGRVYARAGIPVYWLVNLVERRIEVFTDPTGPDASPAYRRRQDFGAGDSLPLVIDGQELGPIPLSELMA